MVVDVAPKVSANCYFYREVKNGLNVVGERYYCSCLPVLPGADSYVLPTFFSFLCRTVYPISVYALNLLS